MTSNSTSNSTSNATSILPLLAEIESLGFEADSAELAWRSALGGTLFLLVLAVSAPIAHLSGFSSSAQGVSAALAANLPPSVWHRLPSPRLLRALTLGVGYVLPLAMVGAWAGILAPAEPDGCYVFGLGVLLVGAAALLGAFAIGVWRQRCWIVTGRILVAGSLAAGLPLALLLLLVAQRPYCASSAAMRAFPFTALTAIAMALNMLPVTAVIYLSLRRGGSGAAGLAAAPLQQPLPSSANVALLVFGFRRSRRRPLLQCALMYAASLFFLVAYSFIVWNQSGIDEAGGPEASDFPLASLFALPNGPPPSRCVCKATCVRLRVAERSMRHLDARTTHTGTPGCTSLSLCSSRTPSCSCSLPPASPPPRRSGLYSSCSARASRSRSYTARPTSGWCAHIYTYA